MSQGPKTAAPPSTYTTGWRVEPKQIPPDQGIFDCTFSVDIINPDADHIGDEYTDNVATYAKVTPFPGNNHRNGFRAPAHRYYLKVHESTFCEGAWAIQTFHE
jgi:hypothetical protein